MSNTPSKPASTQPFDHREKQPRPAASALEEAGEEAKPRRPLAQENL